MAGTSELLSYERPTIDDLGTLADITRGNPVVSTGGIAVSLQGADYSGPAGDLHVGGVSVQHDGVTVYGP